MANRTDTLKRYLDAGMAFTELRRSQAESIVKDLVKAGEVSSKEFQHRVDDLMDRSRKNTEALVKRSRKRTEAVVETIRTEIATQLSTLGVATKKDVTRLERMITSGNSGRSSSAKKKTSAAKSTTKTATAAAKKPAARKTAAGKKSAPKSAARPPGPTPGTRAERT